MATAYLVPCQVQGRADLNAAYPQRLTRPQWHDSDGWIADSNHHPPSDHIPDAHGAVRATDNDVDALPDPMVLLAAFCAHPATRYVIFHNRIYHRSRGFAPHAYTGAYHHHMHRSTEPTAAADNNTTRLRLPGVEPGTGPVTGGMTRFATVRLHRRTATATARTLQRAANKLGAALAVDGIPGPRTIGWVRTFQVAHHLFVDGVCGPKTWAAIAQALLRQHGQDIPVDGNFGPRSTAATVAVQKATGLFVDGIFGPKTMARLIA